MKRYLTIILLLTTDLITAQVDSVELFRQKAYLAKLDGNHKQSVEWYAKILEINHNDYDATLALARLHTILGQYYSALDYYQNLLQEDPDDWEALYGSGNCYLYLEMTDTAISLYRRTVEVLPGNVPGYLALAKALSWNGSIDEAIAVYEQACLLDPTYAEAWAGIGRMYYWKGKPYAALNFYKKALTLDPGNKTISEEYEQILNGIRSWLSGQFSYFQEKEETYKIDALIQKYSFSKRISDPIHININTIFDKSDRDYTSEDSDTSRWYLNTWVKLSWITEHHHLGIYVGYTPTDHLWSAYGMSWQMKYKWGSFGLQNTIDAGYDYFYYWNSVGRNIVNESLQLSFKRWEASVAISSGRIDEKPVRAYKGEGYKPGANPFVFYNFSLTYKILENPVVKIGGQYSFMDYEYQSPLYYSPFERKLAGLAFTLQKKTGRWYFYSGLNYNTGNESYYYLSDQANVDLESGTLKVDNWSASLETGYTWPAFSVSVSASHFKNPYYENWIVFMNLSKSL